jgi:hypothetical protein
LSIIYGTCDEGRGVAANILVGLAIGLN